MTHEISRLRRVGRAASRGGIVLSVVGLGMSCYEIAQARDAREKDLIAVKAIAGTGIGLAAGVIAGTFLAATPVGWGVALLVAVGTGLASYYGAETAGYLYKASGEPIRIVAPLGIDQICHT